MTLPEPAHPTVNWEIKERGADGWRVQVTCPVCLQARFEPTRTVRYRVRAGRFTGLCRDDWRSRPVTNSGRPPGNPPHPAVNWDSQRPGPNGMQVQVTCPICMEDRCEAAKAVRYRILQGRFTGRCRLHAHLASQQPRPEAAEMQHPAVDWHARERRDGEYWVKVKCPACQQTRFEIAKSVRYRIRQGKYTGLCRADAQRARVAARRQAEGLSAEYSTMVEVMCPICQETRLVSAASVRRQKKLGTFTGRCGKDRLVGATRGEFRARPANPFVDWMDREVVVEAGYPPRRRSMIRIHCPHCGAVRLVHPAALERSLVTGTFRPECPLHRRDPLRQRPGESFPDESSRAG